MKLNSIRKNHNTGRDKRKIEKLEKEIRDLTKKEMTLQDIYSVISKPENCFLMPNIKKLVLLATLSPVGNAIVERLFSLMNITKTLLRNRLGDETLDLILRINKEAPELWTEEEKEKLVELWVAMEEKFRWKL